MANTGSQAASIRDLLVERLELFDPTLETSETSPLYSQVIQPVFDALGTDPFDVDAIDFLKDRVRQEFPSVSATDGDAIVDLLIKPLSFLTEALKRETEIIRRGQSVRNASTMRLEDAEALAANFFVSRRSGSRASGTVRVLYSAPTFVSIISTVSFSTSSGLRFFPIRPQFFPPEVLLLQRSGTFYYVDVAVVAEEAGEAYNVSAGELSRVNGLSGASKITNIVDFSGGTEEETASELLSRTAKSLTERSLNTHRGIAARLYRDFPTLRNLEVAGFGDPEMNRDIITGSGHGRVVASGICFIVGQFCFMFSQFEDRGLDGTLQIQEGDEIDLNYWKFLYDVPPENAHEVFTIESILFDTREIFEEELPSMLLFQLSGTPTVAPPVAATLPGTLPGVFASVRTKGVIEISDIPGGITNPDGPRGEIIIEDNQIHIGGHYDVWVRPSSDLQTTTDPGVKKSESAFLEGVDAFTAGSSQRFRNQLHRKYTVEYSVLGGSIQLGEPVRGSETDAVATVATKSLTEFTFTEFNDRVFQVGETLTGQFSGGTATITAIDTDDWAASGVAFGMLFALISGEDTGVYKILDVDGPLLYVDVDLTATEGPIPFRIISEVSLDLFSPKELLLPFGEVKADNLISVIGSETVRTDADLLLQGVQVGDSLEILDGDDKGVYTIAAFDTALGGKGAILSAPMTSSGSGILYQVYRPGIPLQTPMVRIVPGGVTILDPTNQDTGNILPYALPVEGRALEAFAGAGQSAFGRNGFVLADPGPAWQPTGDLIGSRDDFEDAKLCFSDECLECDGFIAVVTFLDDGSFYVDSNLPPEAVAFLQDIRQWVVDIITNLVLGDDAMAFADGLHPFILGPPSPDTLLVTNILHQAEICIPGEVFDGCNNVFVGIPEFDWENEFTAQGPPFDTGTVTFAEALDDFNSGEMEGSGLPPALITARPGDSLTVLAGSNAGAYVIQKVYKYKLCHGGAILDEGGGSEVVDMSKCYDVVIAVIDGTFPVEPLAGLREFFEDGVPDLQVPLPPLLPIECIDLPTGDVLSPWDVFESVLTWLFQWLDSMGFDLPDGVTLDPGETLKALWQLLFHEYVVGQPTCEQNVRLAFVEPTSFTAYGNQPCAPLEYNLADPDPAVAVGELITLPMADLEGQAISLTISDLLGEQTLSGVLPAEAGTAATVADLSVIIQSTLDSTSRFITVVGTSSPTGALTVTTVKSAVDLKLTLDFPAQLGFYSLAAGKWAAMHCLESSGAGRFQVVIPAGDASIEYTLSFAVAGSVTFEVVIPEGTYTLLNFRAALEVGTANVLSLLMTPGATLDTEVNFDGTGGRLTLTVGFFDLQGAGESWTGAMVLAPGTTGVDLLDLIFPDGYTTPVATTTDTRVIGTRLYGIAGPTYEVETLAGTSLIEHLWGGGTNTEADYDLEAPGLTTGLIFADENPLDPGRFDLAAAALNAHDALVQDGSGDRQIYFVGGDRLEVRTIAGGVATLLRLDEIADDEAGGFRDLGFDFGTAVGEQPITQVVDAPHEWIETAGVAGENVVAIGDVLPGPLVREWYHPPEPTLFSVVTGASELLYGASGNVDPFQVFPGETTSGKVPPTELPRDIAVSLPYVGATTTILRFSDTFLPSPLEAGIQEKSDILYVYGHRIFLEHTIALAEEDITKDRVIAVTTAFGSNVISLLATEDPDFNFLSGTSGDAFDEVQIGDLVFIEEGADAAGYTVVERSEFALTLNAAMTESAGRVFKSGNDASIQAAGAVLRSETAFFNEDDIGRFATIWAMNRQEYDGSYRILSVEDFGTHSEATLDTDVFPETEQEIHWAVVKAPTEDPPVSLIGGRTALVGVRPIRIYSGTPSQHRVVVVSPHLERDVAEIEAIHDAVSGAPRQGYLQPYQVVRNGVQHISSTAMHGQGRELGLYWFDVLAKSFGGDSIHNIPEGTRMEPVFGTYDSDGYRLEVTDPNLVYSSRESTRMVSSALALPVGFTDTIANKVPVEGSPLRISYDYAPIVDQVQRLLSSEADRVLCANPLARHFLPSYVYFDMTISGGGSITKMAAEVADKITSLNPVDDLDVSQLEKVFHDNNVTRYEHPVTALVVTHDLDRRLVGFRSVNKIGEEEVVYHGSNRTSFFIPGPDISSLGEGAVVPDGERISIVRGIPSTTLR